MLIHSKSTKYGHIMTPRTTLGNVKGRLNSMLHGSVFTDSFDISYS